MRSDDRDRAAHDGGPSRPLRLRGALLGTLAALSAFGPMSLDLYLPAFEAIARDLGTSTDALRLTFAACLLGLGSGQLVYGPLSDRFGRKPPLLVGLGVYVVASMFCATAPSLPVLVVLRLLQGLGGCAGLVIGRAVVRDSFSGRDLARSFSVVTTVAMVAPLLAPSIGAGLLHWTDWRAVFVVQAGFGAACFAAAMRLPETHPRTRRTDHGVVLALRTYATLVVHRPFVVPAVLATLTSATLLTYISSSSLVFVTQLGVTPQEFGLVFMVMAVCFISGAQLNVRLLRRYDARTLLLPALAVEVLGLVALVALAATGAPLWAVLTVLAPVKVCLGIALPNTVAETLRPVAASAGSASALMGAGQFGLGAVAASLLARAPGSPLLSMASAMLGLAVLALALAATGLRRDSR